MSHCCDGELSVERKSRTFEWEFLENKHSLISLNAQRSHINNQQITRGHCRTVTEESSSAGAVINHEVFEDSTMPISVRDVFGSREKPIEAT
jgi:hypothetical protein